MGLQPTKTTAAKTLFLIILITFCAVTALAHQPRIVQEASQDNPVIVNDPEVSKAYYAELTGTPHYYKIQTDKTIRFYVNILTPEAEGGRPDFLINLFKDEKQIVTIQGNTWKPYYEEFARDDYWQGPEYESQLEPGTYYIVVSGEKNTGKYALAIGKVESFPIKEIIRTIYLLPTLKTWFFGKSLLTAYFNIVGVLLLLVFVLLFIMVTLTIWYRKKTKAESKGLKNVGLSKNRGGKE